MRRCWGDSGRGETVPIRLPARTANGGGCRLSRRVAGRTASRGIAVVIPQHAAQPLAAADRAAVAADLLSRVDQLVAQSLMVAFRVVQDHNTKPTARVNVRSAIGGIRCTAGRSSCGREGSMTALSTTTAGTRMAVQCGISPYPRGCWIEHAVQPCALPRTRLSSGRAFVT